MTIAGFSAPLLICSVILPVRNFGGFGVTQALGIGFAAVDCPVAKKTLTFDLFNRN